MTAPRRAVVHLLAAVATALALMIVAPAGPAQAAYEKKCSSFADCARKGFSSYGFDRKNPTMYWRTASGVHCTNYAAYRLITRPYEKVSSTRPWTSTAMAYNWGTANAKKTNGTPAVGAIAWWKANRGPVGWAGHVAYVERVVSSNEIWVSEGNSYASTFTWHRIVKDSRGSWPSGFIHFKDEKIHNTKKPSVSGTARVDRTLTANEGSWVSSSKRALNRSTMRAAFRYQWYADGKAVSKATHRTYTPGTSQRGKKMSVAVWVTSPVYRDSARVRSGSTAAVDYGSFSAPTPTVSGTAKVGSTVTASRGSWSPSSGTSFSYLWYADGALVHSSTSASFVVPAGVVGQRLSVAVKASRTAYRTTTGPRSRETTAVSPGEFGTTATPTISGSPVVGGVLTARPGAWTPAPTFTFQWFADGSPVAGAVEETFAPTSAQLGQALTVAVTGSSTGYVATTRTSAPTAAVGSAPAG